MNTTVLQKNLKHCVECDLSQATLLFSLFFGFLAMEVTLIDFKKVFTVVCQAFFHWFLCCWHEQKNHSDIFAFDEFIFNQKPESE